MRTKHLTFTELEKVTAGITYWPGWSFCVREDRFLGPVLRIVATVPNAYQPGRSIDLGIESRIPPLRTTDDYLDWVLWRLCEAEIHECREGLRYQGALVSDPHDPDQQDDG